MIKEPYWKRQGFKTRAEYNNYLAKKQGFKNYYEYQKNLAERQGFESLSQYSDRKKACKILREHHETTKDDPESLTTEFLQEQIGILCDSPKKSNKRHDLK